MNKTMNIKKMKSGFKHEYAQVLTDIFKKYDLYVTDDGVFVDSTTKQKVHENHVKCMLRNDYIKSGHGQLSGRLLCQICDRFLHGMKKAAKFVIEKGDSCFIHETTIDERFLK